MTEQTAALSIARLDQYKGLDMVNYASSVFPTEDETSSVFTAAEAFMPMAVPRRNYFAIFSQIESPMY